MSAFRDKAQQLRVVMDHAQQKEPGKNPERIVVHVRQEPSSRARMLDIIMKGVITRNRQPVVVSDKGPDAIKQWAVSRWFDLAWRDMQSRYAGKQQKRPLPEELTVRTLLQIAQSYQVEPEAGNASPGRRSQTGGAAQATGAKQARQGGARPVPYQVGVIAQALLAAFYDSADTLPSDRHLPSAFRSPPSGSYEARIGLAALELAKEAWKEECSPASRIPASRRGIVKMWLSMGRAGENGCVVIPHGEGLTPAQCKWLSQIDARAIVCDDPILRAASKFDPVNAAFSHFTENACVYDGMIHELVSPGLSDMVSGLQARLSGKVFEAQTVSASRREPDDLGTGISSETNRCPPAMISISDAGRLSDALHGVREGQAMILPNSQAMRRQLELLKNFSRLVHYTGDKGVSAAPDEKFLRRFPSVEEAYKRTEHDAESRALLTLAVSCRDEPVESDISLLEYLITDGEQVLTTPAMRPVQLFTLDELEQRQSVLSEARLGSEFDASGKIGALHHDKALYRAIQHVTHALVVSESVARRLEYYREHGADIAKSHDDVRRPDAAQGMSEGEKQARMRQQIINELEQRRQQSSQTAAPPESSPDVSNAEAAGNHERSQGVPAKEGAREPTQEENDTLSPYKRWKAGQAVNPKSQEQEEGQPHVERNSAADMVDRLSKEYTPEQARAAFSTLAKGRKKMSTDRARDDTPEARGCEPGL